MVRSLWRARLPIGVLALTASLATVSSAIPALESLHQWNPSESYQGESDADHRLDRPVKFWQAGLSLEELFADIERQTGVKLGFYPENDENRRVRVHLFLNQQNPPTLRALMAQLRWVVDCSFFVSSTGSHPVTEGEQSKSYYLMSTSIAGGAKGSLQARADALWKAREGRWKEISSKLDEYQQALSLSREELTEKYQGKDDLMLLNLLDPQRRAVTEFMCRRMSAVQSLIQSPAFPAEGAEAIGFGSSIGTSDFTAEDIADLKLAFGLPESVLRDPQMMFDINVEAVGRLRVNVSPEYPQEARWSGFRHLGPYLLADLTDDAALPAKDLLALRRALGEKIPPEREAGYLNKLEQEVAAAKRERERARLEAERSLSPRAKDPLESTSLTLRNATPGFPVTPWLAEEAVARATGMNIISDGLVWSGRYDYGHPPFGEEKNATVSALAALDSFTHEPVATGMRRPSWEWEDAGDFLRFRTADRDIWRAAMLPHEFLDWVNSLLRPHLPEPETLAKQKRLRFTMPIGLVYMTRMLGKLSDLQMKFGADINYGDPKEVANIAKHQAIRQLTYGAMMRPKFTRFLASLSDAQWEQVKGEGLRCDYDLSPEQQVMLTAALQRSGGTPPRLTDSVVRLDREQEAEGFYMIGVTRSATSRDRDRAGWGADTTYASRMVRVDAVAPEP